MSSIDEICKLLLHTFTLDPFGLEINGQASQLCNLRHEPELATNPILEGGALDKIRLDTRRRRRAHGYR